MKNSMNTEFSFDLIVIGGGPAGLVASKLARGMGKSVALIEKERLGGTCTLTGCVPSKTLIHIARTLSESRQLKAFDVTIDAEKMSTKKIMDHVRAIREEIYAGHSTEKLEELGISVIYGDPHFVDSHTITCNGKTLTARAFVITTGSRPAVPPI